LSEPILKKKKDMDIRLGYKKAYAQIVKFHTRLFTGFIGLILGGDVGYALNPLEL
jgi:hypothetical protein